jgi:hypothetical protein
MNEYVLEEILMSEQKSDQQQQAEIEAHNAVNHALSELNQAAFSNDIPSAEQAAREHLDQAQLQLAQARHGKVEES